jgi:predicted Fe-S protein YdhL (DUF1289 family)
MDMVIRDTPKLVVEQSQVIGAKRRDFEFFYWETSSPKEREEREIIRTVLEKRREFHPRRELKRI